MVCDAQPGSQFLNTTGSIRNIVVFVGHSDAGSDIGLGFSANMSVRTYEVAVFGGHITGGAIPRWVKGYWVQGTRLSSFGVIAGINDVAVDGVILDVTSTSTHTGLRVFEGPTGTGGLLDNTAFVGITTVGGLATHLVKRGSNDNFPTYRNLSFVYPSWGSGTFNPVSFNAGGTGAVHFQDMLLHANGHAANQHFAADVDNGNQPHTFSGDFCIGGLGAVDVNAPTLSALGTSPATVYRDQTPRFKGLNDWPPRVDLMDGQCGEAGIKTKPNAPGVYYNWAMGKSGLGALKMSDEMGSQATGGGITLPAGL